MYNIAILLKGTLEQDLWKKCDFGKSWSFGPIGRKKMKKNFHQERKKVCLVIGPPPTPPRQVFKTFFFRSHLRVPLLDKRI